MSKDRKPYDRVKAATVKWLANKYQRSEAYIREIVNGTYTGGIAPDVMKDYKAKYQNIREAMK